MCLSYPAALEDPYSCSPGFLVHAPLPTKSSPGVFSQGRFFPSPPTAIELFSIYFVSGFHSSAFASPFCSDPLPVFAFLGLSSAPPSPPILGTGKLGVVNEVLRKLGWVIAKWTLVLASYFFPVLPSPTFPNFQYKLSLFFLPPLFLFSLLFSSSFLAVLLKNPRGVGSSHGVPQPCTGFQSLCILLTTEEPRSPKPLPLALVEVRLFRTMRPLNPPPLISSLLRLRRQ